MLAPWVVTEMRSVNFYDKRLDDRLQEVLLQFSARPSASIPAACGGYAETTAAYRFLGNEKVTLEGILASHIKATKARIAAQTCAVVAQDTSELDFTRPDSQVAGAGPMDGSDRRGAFLHLLHAFADDGTPLGTVAAKPWTREEDAPKTPRSAPIEEKESQRWVDALRTSQQLAREVPGTQVICVADSEADIYELLAEAEMVRRNFQWIVRACYDRSLQKPEENSEKTAAEPSFLAAAVGAQEVLFTSAIRVRGRKPKVACEKRARRSARESREATVEVRAVRVKLRPPPRKDRVLPPIEVNVVLVREIDPPAGEEPVEWVLLTSLPIDSDEDVRNIIRHYCTRWMIEIFFRTLKSGCRIEQRRFETMHRMLNCLGVYLIVAWRTLFVCRMGRSCPDISCEAVFDEAEWKSVYQFVKHEPPPEEPPRLQAMVRLVAQLGGYVNKKREDEPGPQTVWLGIARMNDLAHCWSIFRPPPQPSPALV